MKIVAVQMNIEFGSPDANRVKVAELIEKASIKNPDVIVLPEMWNTSFDLKNIHQIADAGGEPTKSLIGQLARKNNVNIIAGSVADKHKGQVYNRMYAFNRHGEVIAFYDKAHLVHHAREHEFLAAGTNAPIFEIEQVPCGAIICYDLRFPELARTIALKGAKVLFIPAQWPETRIDHWRSLVIARAIENQLYVVAVNRIGNEFKANFPGNSLIVDPWGTVLAQSSGEEQLLEAEIDISLVDRIRRKIPCFSDRNIDAYNL